RALFDQVEHRSSYRLIGVGLSDLSGAEGADTGGDLLDPGAAQRSKAERAADSIRSRFGEKAILKGRALR
ncbi:MAG TPA: DNA polymerase IV, partial [Sulfitobacter sp.]|nr:DNA polymerase IV [Sulfitobacter sp.]